jgi:hypothetical protein
MERKDDGLAPGIRSLRLLHHITRKLPAGRDLVKPGTAGVDPIR